VVLAERFPSARLTKHRATSHRQISPHTAPQSHDSSLTLTLRYGMRQISSTMLHSCDQSASYLSY